VSAERRPLADWLREPPAAGLLDGAARRAAGEAWLRLGPPTKRLEAWRYTDFGELAGESFALDGPEPEALAGALERLMPTGVEADTLVFVDGRPRPELWRIGELPDGVGLGSLRGMARAAAEGVAGAREMLAALGSLADAGSGAFAALNSALAGDGCGLYLPAGVELARPVQVIQLQTGVEALLVQPRLLVVAGRGSAATVFEGHGGPGGAGALCNAVGEFRLAEEARIEHVRVQRDGDGARRVHGVEARLAAGAALRSHTFTVGGGRVRNESRLRLEGPGAEAEINGLTLLRGASHVDNHTLVEHVAPDCRSRQAFKSVLDGPSRAVFTGRILVAQDAQRTDAEQASSALLLGDEARSWARPQLEIHADDVKCTHGATVGSLDADSLFYLRARGIPADLARRLLIHAFASGLLARVRRGELLAPLDRLITRTLAG